MVCLSERQTFAYCIPLYNARRFLDSLAVCCAQELSGVRERAASLGPSAVLPGVECGSETQQLLMGKGWRGVGYKGESKALPTGEP